MAVWGNRVFRGMRPRVPARLLEEGFAADSRDFWVDQGQLSPIEPTSLENAVRPENPSVGGSQPLRIPAGAQSVYRYDTTRWLWWPQLVDVALAPIVGGTDSRIMWTQANGPPQMANSDILVASPDRTLVAQPRARRLGVPAPETKPQVRLGSKPSPASDTDDGVSHAWVYTWVSDLNEEGPPSPPSDIVDRVFGRGTGSTREARARNPGPIQTTYLFGMATNLPEGWRANVNLATWKKRIYRTATDARGVTTFQFLAEIAYNVSQYTDSQNTTGAGGLVSALWDPPNAELRGVIALTNGVLAAFRGREVHLSEPYQPHAWPGDYVQIVESDIVGLSSFGTTLVVCTTGEPAFITGSSPRTAVAQKIEAPHPCVSKRSIAYASGAGVLYASNDGLVSVSSQGAQLISTPVYDRATWQRTNPEDIQGFYRNGVYFMFKDDEILGYHLRDGYVIRMGNTTSLVWRDRDGDTIYTTEGSQRVVYTWQIKEGRRLASWTSREYVGALRTFSMAQVIFKGDERSTVELQLLADGNIVLPWTSAVSHASRPFRLPRLPLATTWQYRVRANARILEVRIGAARDMV